MVDKRFLNALVADQGKIMEDGRWRTDGFTLRILLRTSYWQERVRCSSMETREHHSWMKSKDGRIGLVWGPK